MSRDFISFYILKEFREFDEVCVEAWTCVCFALTSPQQREKRDHFCIHQASRVLFPIFCYRNSRKPQFGKQSGSYQPAVHSGGGNHQSRLLPERRERLHVVQEIQSPGGGEEY